MKKEIILELQAQDFEGTEYSSWKPCAVEKALIRQEKLDHTPSEVIERVIFNGQNYEHIPYTGKLFSDDKAKAQGQKPETVIRTLTLTKI